MERSVQGRQSDMGEIQAAFHLKGNEFVLEDFPYVDEVCRSSPMRRIMGVDLGNCNHDLNGRG